MNARTDPLPEDVAIVPLDLPAAAGGCVFFATKTPNVYICVDAGVAFPLRFVVDADGARGVCGCGGDMPCAHITALYALPTPPVDPAPQLINVFFVGSDYEAPTTEPTEPTAPAAEPDTGIAAITKSDVKVSLRARVVQLWESTSPSIGQVGLLADDHDKIKFVKWANSGLVDLVEGCEYDFGNALTDEYNGKMSVKFDKKSTIVPVGDQPEPEPEPEPVQKTPEPATPPKSPGKSPGKSPDAPNAVVCKYCGETLDRSNPDAVLNHIEKCKDNNTPQVPVVPSGAKDAPTETIVPEHVPTVAPIQRAESPRVPDAWLVDADTSSQMNGKRNIIMALCKAQQAGLSAVTDSTNTFHNNSKYADLASVWEAIRKPLTDNGICVIQTTEPYDGGITVVTTLMHISGESFVARLSCIVPPPKPDRNGHITSNVQALGSTITYLRRYLLGAMTGVCPVDDDGEAAMGR